MIWRYALVVFFAFAHVAHADSPASTRYIDRPWLPLQGEKQLRLKLDVALPTQYYGGNGEPTYLPTSTM